MYDSIKKRVRQYVLFRVIITIIVIIGSFVLTKFAAFELFKGPVTLTSDMNLEDYEGKYVKYNAVCVLGEYAQLYMEYEDSTKSELEKISYFVFDEARSLFFGIHLDAKNEATMDKLIEDSLNYFYSDDVEQPEGFTVTGTLQKIVGEELYYYEDFVNEYFSDYPEYADYAIPYAIYDNTIGGEDSFGAYISIGLTFLGVIYIIFTLVGFSKQKYKKKIDKYLESNPSYSVLSIESDFEAAEKVGKDVWVGSQWTIYVSGTQANILYNKDLIWAYYFYSTGKHARSLVRTFDKQKNTTEINVSKQLATQILENYSKSQPHLVVGYDKELEKLYKKDFNAFLSLKYNAPATEQNTEHTSEQAASDTENVE